MKKNRLLPYIGVGRRFELFSGFGSQTLALHAGCHSFSIIVLPLILILLCHINSAGMTIVGSTSSPNVVIGDVELRSRVISGDPKRSLRAAKASATCELGSDHGERLEIKDKCQK